MATLAGVFGTAWWATAGSEAWLIGTLVCGAFAGVCMAAVVRGWELRVRTPQGTALWLRVESFRRFLAESEAYHAEEAAKRGVLREYTAWAVATGEIDRWSKAVSAAALAPAVTTGLAWAYVGPSLIHSTSSSSTAPSSSGGGGGGGVGGGGGGGGGGSW